MTESNRLRHAVRRQCRRQIFNGHVGGGKHEAQWSTHDHHANFGSTCEIRKHLGMAGIRVPRQIDRLFVDGSRHDCRNASVERSFDGFFDIDRLSGAGFLGDFSRGKRPERVSQGIQNGNRPIGGLETAEVDAPELERHFRKRDSPRQHFDRTDDEGTAQSPDDRSRERLHDHLGADPRWITHRDAQQRLLCLARLHGHIRTIAVTVLLTLRMKSRSNVSRVSVDRW